MRSVTSVVSVLFTGCLLVLNCGSSYAEDMNADSGSTAVREVILQFAVWMEGQRTNGNQNAREWSVRASNVVERFEALSVNGNWLTSLEMMMLFPVNRDLLLIGLMEAYTLTGNNDRSFEIFSRAMKGKMRSPRGLKIAEEAVRRAKDPKIVVAGYYWLKAEGVLKTRSRSNREFLATVVAAFESLNMTGRSEEVRSELAKMMELMDDRKEVGPKDDGPESSQKRREEVQ